MTEQTTRLTYAELQAIEKETALLAGEEPTIEALRAAGFREQQAVNQALEWIASAGRIVTLIVAELIQALAALIIAVVFAALEFYRVQHGAVALGQSGDQAALIAFAVVTANIVHPIYSLRQLRGRQSLEITRQTGRGYVESFWLRLTGKPITEEVDLYHNPALHLAAQVITWSTVVLAVYDILGPLLSQVFTNTATRPVPLMIMEFIMGLGLSIAGVFFLQSASHEIGVRTLTDAPPRLVDALAAQRAEHAQRKDQIRVEVRARLMAAKIAELERKAAAADRPFGSTAHGPGEPVSIPTMPSANGHGAHVNEN